MIVSKKYFFLFIFLFAGAERRNGEILKFQLLITVSCGVATFTLQKVPESAGVSGVFLYFFCCPKPGFQIKTKFGSPAIPRKEFLTTKMSGISMELYGKNN